MSLFKSLVALRHIGTPRAKRTPPKFKGKHWLYPWAMEASYCKAIERLMESLALRVRILWISEYPQLSRTFRRDDVGDDLDSLNQSLLAWQKETMGDRRGAFWSQLFALGSEISTFNNSQWNKFIEGVLGYAFNGDEPWLQPALSLWADNNYSLIKSLTETYIGQVNQMVVDGVQAGLRWEELSPKVLGLDDKLSIRRARLIARDQVGKLNGVLTQYRMQDAGIPEYKWLTSNDERVRSEHAPLHNRICRWDDPTVWKENGKWVPRPGYVTKSHPGYDIQCRCTAIPVLDEFFDSLED